ELGRRVEVDLRPAGKLLVRQHDLAGERDAVDVNLLAGLKVRPSGVERRLAVDVDRLRRRERRRRVARRRRVGGRTRRRGGGGRGGPGRRGGRRWGGRRRRRRGRRRGAGRAGGGRP